MPRYYGRRRRDGDDNDVRYRTIVRVRYVEVAPLAESTPELQWLTDGIVRAGVHLRFEDHPHNIAVAITEGANYDIAYAHALRWLHEQASDNEFAQSLKRWWRANGALTPNQIAHCCPRPERPERRNRRAMPEVDVPAPPRPQAPAPRPVARTENPETVWHRSVIVTMWGDQANAIIRELRANGIMVVDD